MRTNWETPRSEIEPKVDMNSKEVMQLMQRMKYVGSEKLSNTQLRKARQAAVRDFFESAKDYPRWEERIDEIWLYHGPRKDWELENWQNPGEKR